MCAGIDFGNGILFPAHKETKQVVCVLSSIYLVCHLSQHLTSLSYQIEMIFRAHVLSGTHFLWDGVVHLYFGLPGLPAHSSVLSLPFHLIHF